MFDLTKQAIAKEEIKTLPFERLTIFSKKVFCGATNPLFTPGILCSESIGQAGLKLIVKVKKSGWVDFCRMMKLMVTLLC